MDLWSTDLQYCAHQVLIHGEDGDLQHSHDEELYRAGFTQNCTKGDQDRRCAEVSIDDPGAASL